MNGEEERNAALIADLEHSEKPKIRAAADALIALAGSDPTVRATLEALGSAQRKNTWAIAYVLGHLPQPSGTTIRALIAALDHQDPDIRWAIALLLIKLAGTEGEVANLLLEVSDQGTANQKRMAVYCIRDLQLGDAASLNALLAASGDAEAMVRVAAVTSLRTRTDVNATVRNRLLQLFLSDRDPRVCNAAAISLAQLGAPSEEFIAALRAAQHSENAGLRKAASAALSLLENERPASSDG
jgi:HEAT repeat protein